MKTILILLLTLLTIVCKGQIVNGDLKQPIFQIYKDNIYVFNIENDKVFHIRKYNKNLDLLKSFDKKLEESCEGGYALYFQENEIYTCFQNDRPKMGFKPKPRPGFEMNLSYDLTEMKSENLADVGAIKYTVNMYGQASARDIKSSYNSFNSEDFEKEVKQKYSIKEIGPMLSVQNTNNKKQTFQVTNYKDDASERFYNGFYVLTEEGGKATQFKKFEFLGFENVSKEKNCFMEFYPNLVRDNGNSILIPFAQKTHRIATKIQAVGQVRDAIKVDAYFIMGLGVIEINKATGGINTKIFDRKDIDRDLMEEYIVGFEAKDLNSYSFLLRNLFYEFSNFKKTCWSIYNQGGEKMKEWDKNKIYEFTNLGHYIVFDFAKKGYTLEKIKY